MHINIDDSTLEKIEELSKLYKETWGKEIDLSLWANLKGMTQQKMIKCIELMIEDNVSLIVAYTKLFK